MARKVEELLVEIKGDNKSFLNALAGGEKAEKDFSSSISRGMGGVAKASLAAGAAIGAVGVAAVGMGVGIASETEQATIAFTTLLGSAEEADAFISEMRDFAAKTPFEFAGVRDSAQKFLAMGFAAEEVTPILTGIGDAVAAMGGGQEEIGGVTRALTQMQAKGKVSAEEMLQLAERGIPAWQFLADEIGTSIPEAMDQVSKGAVASGVFIDAFLTGSAARFGGAMEAQSQSLAGLFSTFKDTIAVELGEASQGLIEPLKAAIPEVTTALGTLIKTALPPLTEAIGAILPVFTGMAPVVGRVAEMVAGLLGSVAPVAVEVADALLEVMDSLLPVVEDLLPTLVLALEAVAPLLRVVADILNFLGPILPSLVTSIILMVAAMKAWAAVQAILNVLLTANPIGLIVVAIAALIAGIVLLVKHWDTVKAAMIATWDKIVSVVAPAVEKIKNLAGDLFQFLKDAFFKFHPLGIIIKHWDEIVAFFKEMPDKFKEIGKEIAMGLVKGIDEAGEKVVDGAKDLGKKAWEGTKDWLGISSPSRLFMELGAFSAEGFMEGMDGLGAQVDSALAPIAGIRPQGGVSGGGSSQVVIRVEAGAFKIDAAGMSPEALTRTLQRDFMAGIERRWARQVF